MGILLILSLSFCCYHLRFKRYECVILVRSRRNSSSHHITCSSVLSVQNISRSFYLLDNVGLYCSTTRFFSLARWRILGFTALHLTGSDLDLVISHNLVMVSTTLVSRPSHFKLQFTSSECCFLNQETLWSSEQFYWQRKSSMKSSRSYLKSWEWRLHFSS